MFDKIREAAAYITRSTKLKPNIGIVLGTGLKGFAGNLENPTQIPYADIPHFPISTVKSHTGKLIFGMVGEAPVVALQGRFHFYEGYALQEVTFPIRVMSRLGVKAIILSNAAGGLNPEYRPGDLVFIKDHINLIPDNPLRGMIDERLGVRFPDMLNAYDKALLEKACEIAEKCSISYHTGVYAALQGPNLETPAEHQFLRTIGADLAGMSTVPEVIVAKQLGMKVLAVSIVTNQCIPVELLKETSLEDVIEIASNTEPILSKIILKLIDQKL